MPSLFDPVRIVNVEPRAHGMWRITDHEGTRYATYNEWLASLCQIAKDQGRPILLDSKAGWFYRELTGAMTVPDQVQP